MVAKWKKRSFVGDLPMGQVRGWLARHPRWTFHFTPTSCSWLDAVEGYFAKLTRRRLKRGVLKGVVDLQTAIHRFITETNNDPKPFIWTAKPDAILAAFGWMTRWRRLVRDYEARLGVSVAMILVTMGGNLLRRTTHP